MLIHHHLQMTLNSAVHAVKRMSACVPSSMQIKLTKEDLAALDEVQASAAGSVTAQLETCGIL